MSDAVPLNKYAISASFHNGAVSWKLALELASGEHVELPVLDGAEVPILLDILRADNTLYFDPRSRSLTTGWNDPGE